MEMEKDTQIIFETDIYTNPQIDLDPQSKFADFVIGHSKGLIKSEKELNIMVFILFAISMVLTLFTVIKTININNEDDISTTLLEQAGSPEEIDFWYEN